jgi:hypothetical protein
MSISRISRECYLRLAGQADSDSDDLEVGRSWFASVDACVLGRVVFNPASQLWHAIAAVATANGWAEIDVDQHEFATLRSAERRLVAYMADLVTDGPNCSGARMLAADGSRSRS